jgi:hypothetical protein
MREETAPRRARSSSTGVPASGRPQAPMRSAARRVEQDEDDGRRRGRVRDAREKQTRRHDPACPPSSLPGSSPVCRVARFFATHAEGSRHRARRSNVAALPALGKRGPPAAPRSVDGTRHVGTVALDDPAAHAARVVVADDGAQSRRARRLRVLAPLDQPLRAGPIANASDMRAPTIFDVAAARTGASAS